MSSSPDATLSSIRNRINTGINIFNQGRPGSTTERIVNRVSGPSGLNMSGPNNHRNDLGFRAGNAIRNTISNFRR
jgi:hypothetical protein